MHPPAGVSVYATGTTTSSATHQSSECFVFIPGAFFLYLFPSRLRWTASELNVDVTQCVLCLCLKRRGAVTLLRPQRKYIQSTIFIFFKSLLPFQKTKIKLSKTCRVYIYPYHRQSSVRPGYVARLTCSNVEIRHVLYFIQKSVHIKIEKKGSGGTERSGQRHNPRSMKACNKVTGRQMETEACGY